MEINAILSIEPCPFKDVFWLRLSSGFRIEIDALKVFVKWGREKFEKFKIANDLADPGQRKITPCASGIMIKDIPKKTEIDKDLVQKIKAALEEIKKIRNAKA
ncbi:MAG: hypothetical protein KAT69_09175 [Candidatus Aminicenantes bacterium]|nr:hypothetical protein [Candidatus Aminicenantes bacterium]